MGRNIWINLSAMFAGLLALTTVVWYAAPLLDLFGYHPFESEAFRVGTIAIFAVSSLGYGFYHLRERWKSSRELSAGIAGDEVEDDGQVLDERMKDALATLKSASSSKGDPLYDLPWYVIIGPPGSGKTTALVNSGLKFPLARGQSPASIAGVGGTRYCDWWFTEDAVLIDTAGRYTTQDSNARADQKSWSKFLDLLKKTRPRQPINGVLVAISIEDVLTLDQTELAAHASAIRTRMTELHDRLKIDLPVYVLFTKMDLVAGFIEYFGRFGEFQRRAVWGATFEGTPRKNENPVGRAPEEFDALVARLSDHLPDRLQEEPYPAARLRSFGFPAQFATLRAPVCDFLARIFEPTRYRSNTTLRGFYFTSGTQQGTPIDRIIGALAKNFGAEAVSDGFLSGEGKSFFLTDLIGRVIIGEAAWVSTDRAAVRRRLIAVTSVHAVMALVAVAAVAVWTLSWGRNDDLIRTTVRAVEDYQGENREKIAAVTVGDRRFEDILPLLEKIRRLPTGFELRDAEAPLAEGFGLSQRARLTSSAKTSYRAALERFLRPRLLFRLEEMIGAARAEDGRRDRGDLYEAFEVYLMLGNQGPMDKGLVLDWFRGDWMGRLYPGPEREGMRRALEAHLSALLDLDTGTGFDVPLDGGLVRDVQQILVRMNVAERAYRILETRARAAAIRDWQPSRTGTDVATVFDTADGRGVESIRVPGFYTRDGFQRGLIDRLPTIAGQIEKERWVLGDAGRQSVVSSQFDTLADDILAMYAKDFVAAWDDALGRLRIRPLTADRPRYLALAAISSAASPLKQIFEDIGTRTRLSGEGGQGDPQREAPSAAPVVFREGSSAGRAIEDHFRPYYLMVEGSPGQRPVDQIQATLNDIYQGLVGVATESVGSPQPSAGTRQSIATLRAGANRFPAPFDRLLRAASDEFEGNVAGSIVADLQKSLSESVTSACRQAISGRYPFTKTADKEVPLADFGRIFAPGGVMDRYFTQNLAGFVDTTKPEWVWRKETRVGAMLSRASLREFQRAQQIKDAFFSQGGTQPAFALAVQALTVIGAGTTIRTDVDGTRIVSAQTPQPSMFSAQAAPASRPASTAPVAAQWPGPIGLGRFSIEATSDASGTVIPIYEKVGPWALFRMLDGARVSRQGAGLRVAVAARGTEFEYQMNVGSLVNPLSLPALRDFDCPATLQ